MAERDPAFLYYDADVARDISLMNRLERGCYFDLVQHYRRFRGYTMEQLRKILGIDLESCWNALELVLEYDERTSLYHIPWLRISLEKREEGDQKQAEGNEIQRNRIKKYWEEVRSGLRPAPVRGKQKSKPRNEDGNTTEIPRNENNNTESIPFLVNENENENRDGNGGMGEPGRDDGDATWTAMPGKEHYDLQLPDLQVGCVVELLAIRGSPATTEQVLQLWKIFKIQNFTGKSFYSGPEEAYRHFINWSKSQKINAETIQSTRVNGKSAGATQLVQRLGAEIAAGGTPNPTG